MSFQWKVRKSQREEWGGPWKWIRCHMQRFRRQEFVIMFGMLHTCVWLKNMNYLVEAWYSQQWELGDLSGNCIPVELCSLESQNQEHQLCSLESTWCKWPCNEDMLDGKTHAWMDGGKKTVVDTPATMLGIFTHMTWFSLSTLKFRVVI